MPFLRLPGSAIMICSGRGYCQPKATILNLPIPFIEGILQLLRCSFSASVFATDFQPQSQPYEDHPGHSDRG